MHYRQMAVSNLRLDPRNPRLPEALRSAPENEVVAFLRAEEALDELAVSFHENGFFSSDPLIVVENDNGLVNVVVEGNRRLATLKIILNLAGDGTTDFPDLDFTREQLAELASVPCFVVASRSDVSRFIGFRHIGGLRLWPPEAKARYVADAVEQAHAEGNPEPFREVGRQVGSNAQGVRSLYTAISILRYARDEFSANVDELQTNRFGVWLRALSSPDLRSYIGLPNFREFADAADALAQLNEGPIKEVIRDLTPPPGERRALVNDSRMITDYGRILAHTVAREVLRSTGSIEAAKQLVEDASLPERVGRLLTLSTALLDDITKREIEEVSDETVSRSERLVTVARNIHRFLRSTIEERDGE